MNFYANSWFLLCLSAVSLLNLYEHCRHLPAFGLQWRKSESFAARKRIPLSILWYNWFLEDVSASLVFNQFCNSTFFFRFIFDFHIAHCCKWISFLFFFITLETWSLFLKRDKDSITKVWRSTALRFKRKWGHWLWWPALHECSKKKKKRKSAASGSSVISTKALMT